MTAYEIISKKRDGGELSPEEIAHFVNGYLGDRIPSYQMAALLMAIYFQGMTFAETLTLTKVMMKSGDVIDLSTIPGLKVDKHSTGGVGDKVSLVLAPLVAATGVPVPMISGRSLGHTGGTLDKLESIPGFKTNISVEEFKDQVAEIGVAIIAQSERIVPADKKIYALRDATATVDSVPLITASIMSKKLAEGIDALVLDVKRGRGAFFKEQNQVLELARNLIATGEEFGVRTVALLTSMDEPLGYAVGNWLEVLEAVDALKGKGPQDLMEIVFALGALMLVCGGRVRDFAEARERLQNTLDSGLAWQKFLQLVEAQGGDVRVVENPQKQQQPSLSVSIKSTSTGFVVGIDALEIGLAATALGAGRSKLDEEIDHTAGILLNKKTHDWVQQGECLAVAYSQHRTVLEKNEERIRSSFKISAQEPEEKERILGFVDNTGVKNGLMCKLRRDLAGLRMIGRH